MGLVVGIDIGTSGCKCVVLNPNGAVASVASLEYSPLALADGTSEQNPEEWYQAVKACLAEMVRRDGVDLKSVVAVGVTGQMQGVTVVGKDGAPVRNSILWNDTRCEQETKELNDAHGDLFREKITYLATPSLTVSKIQWIRNHEPGNWRATATFLCATGYIVYRLTGRFVADRHNIILSGLNDVHANGWSRELIEACDIDPAKIPELVGCFDAAGPLSPIAAGETGLNEGIPVFSTGGDGGTESYSIGIAGTNRLKIRLGSASTLGMVVRRDPARASGNQAGVPDVNDEYLEVSCYTSACASSIKWVREVFYSEQPKAGSTYALMDKEAAEVPQGSDGLLYHPYLYGESAPYYNPSLRGKFTGINGGMRRGHFVRAAYEGVCFSLRDAIEKTPQFGRFGELILVGGGTKSALWVSILTDVLGRDAIIAEYSDAAFGAALIAGDGAGVWDGLAVARKKIEDSRTVRCDKARVARYDRQFASYLNLAGS